MDARAAPDDIVLLSQSRAMNIFVMKARHTLAQVLQPGYFDACTLSGMRRGDLVEVVTDIDGALLYGRLCVVESSPRDHVLRVKLLQVLAPTDVIEGAVSAQESEDTAAIH